MSDKRPTRGLWGYMQQGGATTEWYAHFSDTKRLAQRCIRASNKAAYNTTELFKLPQCLVATEEQEIALNTLLAEVVSACVEIA